MTTVKYDKINISNWVKYIAQSRTLCLQSAFLGIQIESKIVFLGWLDRLAALRISIIISLLYSYVETFWIYKLTTFYPIFSNVWSTCLESLIFLQMGEPQKSIELCDGTDQVLIRFLEWIMATFINIADKKYPSRYHCIISLYSIVNGLS